MASCQHAHGDDAETCVLAAPLHLVQQRRRRASTCYGSGAQLLEQPWQGRNTTFSWQLCKTIGSKRHLRTSTRDQYAAKNPGRTSAAERVAHGDGAAIRVHLGRVQVQHVTAERGLHEPQQSRFDVLVQFVRSMHTGAV